MNADNFAKRADAPATVEIAGAVERPGTLSAADLAAIDTAGQIDVGQLDSKRRGTAVRLAALLSHVGVQPAARYLTLHASADDFHASVPLDAVRDAAWLIYALDGGPLPVAAGGPIRFWIPDTAACRTEEVDECASVKFVDRIELSAARGFDNRPADEQAHAALHHREQSN